jgi:hypothetical protein
MEMMSVDDAAARVGRRWTTVSHSTDLDYWLGGGLTASLGGRRRWPRYCPASWRSRQKFLGRRSITWRAGGIAIPVHWQAANTDNT